MKNVLIFLAGGLVGAGISYYFTKRKIEMRCQEDINDMKEELIKERGKFLDDVEEDESKEEKCSETKDADEELDTTIYNINMDEMNALKSNFNAVLTAKDAEKYMDKHGIDYSKISKKRSDDKNSSDKKDIFKEDKAMENIEIEAKEFNRLKEEAENGENDYIVMSVLYDFDNDKVYAENGYEINKDLIGTKILDSMEENCEEGDFIYVKNEKDGYIFEVCFSE